MILVVFRLLRSFVAMPVWCRLRISLEGVVRHGSITKEAVGGLWIMMECASTHVSKYDTWISRSYRCLAGRRVRKLLELQLLGSSWWFVIRCLRISGRFMINLELFHRVELSLGCGRVVD